MLDWKPIMDAELQETPEKAVLNRQAQFGRFGCPFRDLNLLDADCGIPRLFGLRRLRRTEVLISEITWDGAVSRPGESDEYGGLPRSLGCAGSKCK
jgi:hypothetical protein